MDSKLYGAGNVAKTMLLLAGIGGLLVAIGYLLGGVGGAVIGLLFGVAISGFSYWKSDSLAVRLPARCRVSETEAPELHLAVGEIARRAGIPKPRVYLVRPPSPTPSPPAATPSTRSWRVTTRLIASAPRRAHGVIAHEVGHIRHRDILIGSVAAAIATVITLRRQHGHVGRHVRRGDDDDRPTRRRDRIARTGSDRRRPAPDGHCPARGSSRPTGRGRAMGDPSRGPGRRRARRRCRPNPADVSRRRPARTSTNPARSTRGRAGPRPGRPGLAPGPAKPGQRVGGVTKVVRPPTRPIRGAVARLRRSGSIPSGERRRPALAPRPPE